ncbi:MAG: glycosyltransferase, partial [Clostridiales bacterium]|nr:glycosyltransferase [Clostridiales bacterium]
FEFSFEKIAKEQLMLNVSPIFNRGLHDRVLAGMANKTVVLTDENPYLRAHFKDKENIALYSLKKIESLSDLAGELMENGTLRENIAKQGYQEFVLNHTWLQRAKTILSWT